ncbi:type II toxin-antitoxin system HipA family toxin [Hyphomonas sp.]|uniref:type II toxin-antitoxin system HipA family toxin n=1 Tax=Hyphomonas sp. TaxID=87 RepID=UPI00391AF20F
MARRSRTQRLNVYLNARFVGRLEKAGTGAVSFVYDQGWIDWTGAMPVSISLPLSGRVYRGAEVVNVFENLLPDAEGVRRNVAERLGAEGVDAFSLLAVTGRDCVGALQFLSEDETPGAAGEVTGAPMSEADIAALIRRLRVNPLGLDPDDEDFRISIAGAQDKTALLKTGGVWHRPTGTTATTHILKPAIGVIHNGTDLTDSVQNEYVCLKFCELLGLDVAEAEIAAFEDQLALSVTRFDRVWTDDGRLLRLPQEDFCQALSVPSTRKYQRDGGPGALQILERLKESDWANEDRYAFFKAQVVYWLLGATDGHAKNFSIALQPGGGFRMTKLYDVLTAQPVVDAGRIGQNRFKLAMSLGDNNHYQVNQIARRHLEQTAAAAGLPRGTLDEVYAELDAAIPAALDALAELAGNTIPEALISSIGRGVRARHVVLGLREEVP